MSRAIDLKDVMNFLEAAYKLTQDNGYFITSDFYKMRGGTQLGCISKQMPFVTSGYKEVAGLETHRIRYYWADMARTPNDTDGQLLLREYTIKQMASYENVVRMKKDLKGQNGANLSGFIERRAATDELSNKRQVRMGAQLDRIENIVQTLLKEWRE